MVTSPDNTKYNAYQHHFITYLETKVVDVYSFTFYGLMIITSSGRERNGDTSNLHIFLYIYYNERNIILRQRLNRFRRTFQQFYFRVGTEI
jgi:hypothetical protein